MYRFGFSSDYIFVFKLIRYIEQLANVNLFSLKIVQILLIALNVEEIRQNTTVGKYDLERLM